MSDDQDLQWQIWKQLQSWNRDPADIRAMLVGDKIPASDKRVRFAGLANYETQGGPVRRDLFAEDENGVYIQDPVLLDRLVSTRLSELTREAQQDGWKWVEAQAEDNYQPIARMRRLVPEKQELPGKQQARLDALKEEEAQIEASLDTDKEEPEENDPRFEHLEKISRQIEKLEAKREQGYSPEAKAASGVLISFDWQGQPKFTYGLVRKEDERKLPSAPNDQRTL